MQKGPCNILAINPGTRYLGVGVFLGTELRDWAIRIVSGKRAKDIISDYIDRYQVNVIAMKALHSSRGSRALKKLTWEIKAISRTKSLRLFEYPIKTIKKTHLSEERCNKRQLMQRIAELYPIMDHEFHEEQKNKNPYLIRMFEAVAIGNTCLAELDSGVSKVVRHQRPNH